MIRNGKYVEHDGAGARCAICRKRRNTVRSVQRHIKQKHRMATAEDVRRVPTLDDIRRSRPGLFAVDTRGLEEK